MFRKSGVLCDYYRGAAAFIQDEQPAKIEETSSSARLNSEIKNLEKEVAANHKALAQATAVWEKELVEFNAEEKDCIHGCFRCAGASASY